MKAFRTELDVNISSLRIGHASPLLTMGSCFADSIGSKLLENKFKVCANPFGTQYNPISIHKVLHYAIQNELPQPNTYVERQGIWHNFEFHSSFSDPDRHRLEQNIINAIGATHHFLKDAATLFITYGTARVFERIGSGEPVSNCHKVPVKEFSTRLLTPDEIVTSFQFIYERLKEFNARVGIVLTVSPVRHLKETLVVNSASKAALRWSCQRICELFSDVEYFPAYEIVMDDLRDYRFYEPDMIHPSGEAIEYIWEKFCAAYCTPSTRELIRQWQEVLAALRHRPFHPGNAAHQTFLTETLRRLELIGTQVPVHEEIALVQSQLSLQK